MLQWAKHRFLAAQRTNIAVLNGRPPVSNTLTTLEGGGKTSTPVLDLERSLTTRDAATAAQAALPYFEAFELLSRSDLFDPAYYRQENPDIVALNVDPLMHYLEWGCHERRDPSAHFNTSHYLRQCSTLGETPANPLAHYLLSGARRGLTPKPAHDGPHTTAALGNPALAPDASDNILVLDIPRVVEGRAIAPIRGGLSVIGWALADAGVESIDVQLDGDRVIGARYGLRRPDVAAAHHSRAGALCSGYAAHLPSKALPAGSHVITLALHDRVGRVTRSKFRIEVEPSLEDRGPWRLRRKMPQAEVMLKRGVLEALDRHPEFQISVPLPTHPGAIARTRQTLLAVMRQTYTNWRVTLFPTQMDRGRRWQRKLLSDITASFAEATSKITLLEDPGRDPVSTCVTQPFVLCLAPGDELGCDGLLELALATAHDPGADFIYSDDRRIFGADRQVEAFFKPAWSPDLLLTTNYIGRAWCAAAQLVARSGLKPAELVRADPYEAVLQLTAAARSIRHVSKVLLEHDSDFWKSATTARQALVRTLKRRKIDAEVLPTPVQGHFRVKRKIGHERVSIIIPTCAAGGHINVCLETLRARTTYSNYEIICIENIPPERARSRRWLTDHADLVIRTSEPFNGSRFNNRAAARSRAKYLLFLNEAVELIDPDWLDALVEQAQRLEVGAVGPLLLYPDRTVRHAGLMLDHEGRGRHSFRHLSAGEHGYCGLALAQRNVIGVTGACLLTRRETFTKLHGFAATHAMIDSDLDYCLRAWRAGYVNVYTPHSRMIHHELASRGDLEEQHDARKRFEKLWAERRLLGDPYLNPNLSQEQEVLTVEREPVEIVHAGHPLFDPALIRRILAVKLDHIGDCITSLPALRRLKQHFPHARLSILSAPGTRAIWSAEPCIDEVIDFSLFHARSGLGKIEVTPTQKQELRDALGARNFDLALDLRKQPDSRHVLPLSGAPLLAGFDHQGLFPWLDVSLEWDEDVPLRPKRSHISDDLIALVDAVGAQGRADREPVLTAPDLALPLSPTEKRLLSGAYVCVHPAAGSTLRQWPARRFAQLIDMILAGRACKVVLVGADDDKAIIAETLREVVDKAGVLNLAGRLQLAQLRTLLGGACLFVGNNSGPQHIAAALGVATVGIHSGVADAREWGPLGRKAIAVRRDMSCSPCYLERPEDCPRALACITQLEAIPVYRACEDYLPQAQRGAAAQGSRMASEPVRSALSVR